jgi:serine/threonine-protein kinase
LTHLIGKQLGRYTIQEEIGRGGMARVYRAQDSQLKRIVAIKVLLPQLAVDPEFAQRFEREAVTAANLRHPNIVTIYDVGEQDGLRYIAMEYVRGHTLHTIIEERGALGLGYAIPIIGPVAAALDYAHRQGAVHRDIKPQNIMIDVDGRVLLTDFGIAQAPDGSSGGQRLTRTGIFMGTPEYISPEQASAQRVDGRSDLYSLGIATYEVITGNVPFSGATPQLIVAHAQTPPPPITTQDRDLPPELDLLMARILAKRPDQRFATGAAFVDQLRNVARQHGLAVASPRQLAALVPSAASAGTSTIARSRQPLPPAASPPPVVPRVGSDEPTQVGPTPVRPAVPAPPRSRPAVEPPTMPRAGLSGEYAAEPDRVPAAPPRRTAADPPDNDGGRRMAMVIGGLFGGLFLVVLFVVINRPFAGAGPNVTPTRPLPSSTIPTLAPSATPTATATPVPTATPTVPPIEATAEPLAPTEEPAAPIVPTPVPPPPDTFTPEPPPPDTPTVASPTPPSVTPESPTPASPTVATPSTAPPTVTTEEPVSPSPEPSATATVSPAASAPATAVATTPPTSVATDAPTAAATAEPPTPELATVAVQPTPAPPTVTP